MAHYGTLRAPVFAECASGVCALLLRFPATDQRAGLLQHVCWIRVANVLVRRVDVAVGIARVQLTDQWVESIPKPTPTQIKTHRASVQLYDCTQDLQTQDALSALSY
jgi:hypothetical protein